MVGYENQVRLTSFILKSSSLDSTAWCRLPPIQSVQNASAIAPDIPLLSLHDGISAQATRMLDLHVRRGKEWRDFRNQVTDNFRIISDQNL